MPGETRYIYDGMLVVQERNGSNVPTVSYTRGLDLSGSLPDGPTAAGGIGALLAGRTGARVQCFGAEADYLRLLERSWIQATSGLFAERTSSWIGEPSLSGGVVRGSSQRLTSAWPSAKEIPAARL